MAKNTGKRLFTPAEKKAAAKKLTGDQKPPTNEQLNEMMGSAIPGATLGKYKYKITGNVAGKRVRTITKARDLDTALKQWESKAKLVGRELKGLTVESKHGLTHKPSKEGLATFEDWAIRGGQKMKPSAKSVRKAARKAAVKERTEKSLRDGVKGTTKWYNDTQADPWAKGTPKK